MCTQRVVKSISGGIVGLLMVLSAGSSMAQVESYAMLNGSHAPTYTLGNNNQADRHQGAGSDLFISEYVQGTGYNKAIELYNGNNHTIDLSQYQLAFYLNGATTVSLTIGLSGYLTPSTTYVIANSLASSEILIVANLTHSALGFDGDDVVVLTRKDQIIDSIGQVGVPTGSAWGNPPLNQRNLTIRRKALVVQPDTNIYDPVDLPRQWQIFAENDFDGLGSHIIWGLNASCTPQPHLQLQAHSESRELFQHYC